MIGGDVTPLNAICAKYCHTERDSVIVRIGGPGVSWRSLHGPTMNLRGRSVGHARPRMSGLRGVKDWSKHPIDFDDRREMHRCVRLFPFPAHSDLQFLHKPPGASCSFESASTLPIPSPSPLK